MSMFGPNLRASVTPAVTAAAYSSGNVVGGLLVFSGMANKPGYGGIVQTVIVRDKAGQNVNYDLLLFDSALTATTVTNKSAVAVGGDDLAKCIGVVQLSGIVLGASSTMGVLTASGLGLAYRLNGTDALYGILVTRGAPTYTTGSDVSVDVIAMPDA